MAFTTDSRADDPQTEQSQNSLDITILGQRPMTAASSSTVRDRDFMLRTFRRPADILQVTPGLFVVQHAGGGKANQYFLRGFDADHGTDLALYVDGVPVNMVSHGHGQGYADLNWLIPEMVERAEIRKGPYFAQYGDFATAGAVNLVTRRDVELNSVSLLAGNFDTYRTLLVTSPTVGEWHTLMAGEVYATHGPFENSQDLERYNIFIKSTHDFGETARLSMGFTSYASGWNASGQIPERAVRAKTLNRFGSIDKTEGGSSQRHSIYANYQLRPDADSELTILAYAISYRLALFSNFTFYSRDPINGDMIEQNDTRTVLGIDARYRLNHHWNTIASATTLGIQLRNDAIDNGLFYDKQRERLNSVVNANIHEGSIALFAQEDTAWTPWLRSVVGIRSDYFGFAVNDPLEDLTTPGNATSGVRQKQLLSPKASVVLSPARNTDVYLNFGMGFHSNDARGVVRAVDSVTPLTRAIGYEIGSRTHLFERIDLAGSLFGLDLQSETVWVGDEGTTEANGATRRYGVELEGRLMILPWLWADMDATFTHAAYVHNSGNGNAVALAPKLLLTGGISVRQLLGFYGRVGVVYIGDRPATEDNFLVAQGFTRIDASAGYRYRNIELALSIQNISNTAWREAQFAHASRLKNETTCPSGTRSVSDNGTMTGCEDVHFTPGAPINVQGTCIVYF